MAQWVNVDGVWKPIKGKWVNVDGVWKPIKAEWVNVDGVWKQTYSAGTALQQGYTLNLNSGSLIQKNADNMQVTIVAASQDSREHWNSLETVLSIDATGYDQFLVDWAISSPTTSFMHSARLSWGSYSYVSGSFSAERRETQYLTIGGAGPNKLVISAVIHTDNTYVNHTVTIKVYSITLKNTSSGATKTIWNISQQP